MNRLYQWLERQKTERVVLGAKLLGAALLLSVYLEIREQAMLAAAELDAARAEARSMAMLGGESNWRERAEQTRDNLRRWQETLWEASTPGVAAARLQSVLEGLARKALLDNVNARVNPDPVSPADSRRTVLQFDVTLRGHAAGLVQLVSDMALHRPRLIVTDLNANLNEGRSILRISGIAPYRPVSPGDDDATS